MKKVTKNIILTIVAITLVLFIAVLTDNKKNNSQEILVNDNSPDTEALSTKEDLTFSNLVDIATQEEVRSAMKYAGITHDSVDSFFEDVNDFNTTVEEKTLVQSGFAKINSSEPEYDLVAMIEMWDSKNPLFIGYNCRITTYDLMKDLITIKNPDPKGSEWMVFDKNALENNPKKLFTEDQYQNFQTFFASIPAEETKDISIHLKNVQANWKSRGVGFPDNDNLSIISVFFHDFENYLFIGHMGVLITTKNGELLFLEKLAFHAPYQAVKFNNRIELNDYLMNKYDTSWNQPEARPFIMENDQLLDGYRKNQNN
jgi:hypothetical protein